MSGAVLREWNRQVNSALKLLFTRGALYLTKASYVQKHNIRILGTVAPLQHPLQHGL